ncbi:MAG: glycohydrolase toxin TNT-related protein [Pseudomonadota bacterium]
MPVLPVPARRNFFIIRSPVIQPIRCIRYRRSAQRIVITLLTLISLALLVQMQRSAWAASPLLTESGSPCGVTMNCVPGSTAGQSAVPGTTSLSFINAAACGPATGGATCGGVGVASQGNQGSASVGAGNPINIISGNKYQREDDLPALPGVLGLEIVRHYNSAYSTPNITTGILGRGWKLSYETALYATGTVIQIVQADGTRVMFARDAKQPGLCSSDNPANGQLRITRATQGENYLWTWPNGKTLQFDHGGRLVQIAVPTGEFVSLQYDVKGMLVQVTDPQGRQMRLKYPGRTDKTGGFRGVATIVSPVGNFDYTYGTAAPTVAGETANTGVAKTVNQAANLSAVRYPGGDSRLYYYEDALRPTPLTGISVQEKNATAAVGTTSATQIAAPIPIPDLQRIGTYLYDRNGRATLSVNGMPARLRTGTGAEPLQPARLVPGTGINQVTLDYATPGVTVLTNSLGQQTTYRHAIIGGQYRLLEARGAGCRQCGDMNVRYGYDQLGRQTVLTHLTPAGEPLRSRRTELDAQGRPVRVTLTQFENGRARTPQSLVRYEYAALQSFSQLPTVIARPSVVPGKEHRLDITYNQLGQATRIKESGFRPSVADDVIERTTSYRYRTINGRSLLAEVDGPLKNGPTQSPADSDITRYTWSGDGSAIEQIMHPTGRIARFEYEHDRATSSKRLIRSIGIDGVVTTLIYSPQGAITQVNRGGAVTHFQHDAGGRTTQVMSPTGERLQFEFQHRHAVTAIRDQRNNRIELLRDTEGEIKQARLFDASGALAQQPRRFMLPSADRRDSGVDGDADGVRALITAAHTADKPDVVRPEPVSPFAVLHTFIAAADSAFDANLDTKPDTNPRSAASSAKDANGNLTTYLSDDFGNLVQSQSPTTGTTTYAYDLAGHILGKGQSDGSRITYQRDPAGRVIGVQAYGPTNTLDENATIVWGAANKPVAINYLAGAETFTYDTAARLTSHTQNIGAKRLALHYRYNTAGQLIAKTLPDGQQLHYRYRGSQHPQAGLLESVWLAGVNNATAHKLSAGLLDRPIVRGMNGDTERYAQRSFAFGNGLTSELALDPQGRIVKAGNAQVGQTTLHYDPLANVRPDDPAAIAYAKANAKSDGEALTDPTRVVATHPILLGQRAQDQAAQALISRLHGKTAGWRSSLPGPPDNAASPKVWSAEMTKRFDTLGRQVEQGDLRYTYDSLNRLTGIDRVAGSTKQEVARYRYNLFGQRIAKTVVQANSNSTKTTHYFYDGSYLAFESGDEHTPTRQYVWLNDKPVAMLQGGSILAIHTDHRHAPLSVTDEARQVVWQARVGDYLNSTPAQGTTLGHVTLNLRGSNQYFDAESGLHYNTHRYFDPVYARYLTPDPLGLAVGPDLYAFGLRRPHTMSDPLGLQPVPATDWSKASYSDKLAEIVKRAAPQVPGEIGAALQEMVQPENLAVMGAVFALWTASQATPIGWVTDLALLGFGIWTAGSGVFHLFQTFLDLDTNARNANCEPDINAAAKALANQFVTSTGEVAGGLTGAWGIKASGGFSRIAKGIRSVVDFGKRQVGKGGIVSSASIARINTAEAQYNADWTVYKKPNGDWKWPPNDGFAGIKSEIVLPRQTRIDRLGDEGGSYLSPEGTPPSQRALTPDSLKKPYHIYETAKDLPVFGGKVASAFDQPGGGTQYLIHWAEVANKAQISTNSIFAYKNSTNNTSGAIAWLVDNGYLRRLTPVGGLK